MGRSIAAVIVGYITMFVLIFLSFTAAYLAMGAEKAFRSGSYDVSTVWISVTFVIGLVTAVVGGVVCSAIAQRRAKPVMFLAALVCLLGVLMALPTLATQPDPGPRTGDVPNMEAMMKAKTPTWVAFLNPVVGAVGAMLGGRLLGPKPSAPRPA